MFTGLIEAVGRITAVDRRERDLRLRLEPGGELMADLAAGDSVAVDGVCLTAVEPDPAGFRVDVSGETLACTTLGSRDSGDRVNLERALLPTTRLGGHLVAGHVDGVGRITARDPDGESWRLRIVVPATLCRYIASKGSICVDGISLTVNEVEGAEFGVNIVPHTLAHTTLDTAAVGRRVNIEVDIVARYLERLLGATDRAEASVSTESLRRWGFTRE